MDEPRPLAAPAANEDKAGWQPMHHLQFGLLALTIALFIITFLVQAFRIPSSSMEPTLLVGDYLLVNKTGLAPSGAWHWLLPYRAPRRSEIIVFLLPFGDQKHLVKRVIGLPGDRITLWHKRVYVNGEPLSEPYARFLEHNFEEFRDNFPRGNLINEGVRLPWAQELRRSVHDGSITVPPDEYFVLGDNRDQSEDSRYWGFVPRGSIVGRPWMIYFSRSEPEEDDDDLPVASGPPDDKLYPLPLRMKHWMDSMRWQRILRIAP
jgi:signal peptidase I